MRENNHSESVSEQFDRLSEIVDKLAERDEARGNMDGALFWDGYNAAINDIRYNGLILVADKLERRFDHHHD